MSHDPLPPLPRLSSFVSQCRTEGCTNRAVKGQKSPYCSKCRSRLKRWGDTRQLALQTAAIKPFEESARRGYERLSPELRARFDALVTQTFSTLAGNGYELRHSRNRYHRRAGEIITRNLTEGTFKANWFLFRLTAIVMAEESDPKLFASERAFRFSVVNAFRVIGGVHDREGWDRRKNGGQGGVRKSFLKLSVVTNEIIARQLLEACAPLVARLRQGALFSVRFNAIRREVLSDLFRDYRAYYQEKIQRELDRLAIMRRLSAGGPVRTPTVGAGSPALPIRTATAEENGADNGSS